MISMALSEKQIQQIREELETCKRPIFFFHDDPDGLCSFLLFYRYVREGKGVVVKTTPTMDLNFARRANEYGADKVFVLDTANMEPEFSEEIRVPIIWIDHHPVTEHDYRGVKYYNCRIDDPNDLRPTTYWCYQVVKQDLWLAVMGCTGDAHFPEFAKELSKENPKLLDPSITSLNDAFYEGPMGKLLRIFAFSLKGRTSEVMKSVKVFTRIKDPFEILNQSTSQGRFIYRRFEKIDLYYQELLSQCTKKVTDEKLFVFIYLSDKMALTKDLANGVFHKYPDKFVIIGREKRDEISISLRYKKNLVPILEKALVGVEGFGGGHEYACGASIKKKDFKQFIENIREQL
jgi:hypothetical protein